MAIQSFSILMIRLAKRLTRESSFGKTLIFCKLCLICWFMARSTMFDVLIATQWLFDSEKTIKASGTLFWSRIPIAGLFQNADRQYPFERYWLVRGFRHRRLFQSL